MTADHYPTLDIVVPMDCYYGECEHIDEECPGESKRVCGVCVSDINGESIGAVLWPCEFAPSDHTDGSIGA